MVSIAQHELHVAQKGWPPNTDVAEQLQEFHQVHRTRAPIFHPLHQKVVSPKPNHLFQSGLVGGGTGTFSSNWRAISAMHLG